ncbi:MAG: PilT/PilU family type 4a pilus ATPase [Pseudomonadales bacterium]|nr:PilT/PilU family type 4a pilus ATPase [Pseudomonadales bacterium]
MDFESCLQILVDKEGSDLYYSTGAPPSAKFYGTLNKLSDVTMKPGEVAKIAEIVMNEEQRATFAKDHEMNLAMSRQGLGRFRVNIFRQRGEVAMVIRRLGDSLPNYKDLGLPPVLPKLIMSKLGLILFVGGTGSGKSTSLAALIDYRNQNSKGHIITIEDPVEFTHPHKNCIVNQREVGSDTHSWEEALANTLRQAPDVILIGEIRHRETMEHALAFAETGHLCLSTLHANNANQAMDRIINFFPEERHPQLLADLSLNMRGIISQRLIPTVDGKRAAAIEILLGTPRAADLIAKGEVGLLKELMEKSVEQGMQTFDYALFKLFKLGKISLEEALKNADSKNNLRLRITLDKKKDKKERKDEPVQTEAEKSAIVKTDPEKPKLGGTAKPATPKSKKAEEEEENPLAGLSLTPMDEDKGDGEDKPF